MRRDFGHVSHNQAPIGGYHHSGPNLPGNHYIFEGNIPRPETRLNPTRFVLRQEICTDEMDGSLLESIPDLYEGEQLGNIDLPTHEKRELIKTTVKNNPITIIVGGTGSGKSTQIPQYLLEAGFNRVHLTQPRRIASYGVASRIEEEIGNVLGKEKAADTVGYQTAEKSTVTRETKIAVITDGIEAVRRLNDDPVYPDEVHIGDEIHERNTNMDLQMAIAKRIVAKDPSARFVFTTATMHVDKVRDYFADKDGKLPPLIEVPGRQFEIEDIEKPSSTVAIEIMECLSKYPGKSMLVFLPGKQEISDTHDKIIAQLSRAERQNIMILPLHAKLPKEQQDLINIPFNGTKIILSTNVAQTSITVPDADIIIDCAEERRVQLDEEGVEGLGKHPISQADVIQRKGRTGRVREGIYIRTRYNEDSEFRQFNELAPFPVPEILRSDIDRTTLRTAAVGIDLEELELLDPIKTSTIDRSKDSLRMLGALDEENKITTTGLLMNRYPVKPSSGRMLVESLRHSATIQSYLAAVVAAVEVGGLPYFAPGVGREWQNLTEEASSDLLAQLDIFIAIQNIPQKHLSEFDLDVQNVKRAQELYDKIVRINNSWTGELLPPSQEEREKLKECIYTGLISYIYRNSSRGQYVRAFNDRTETPRELSDRSVVKGNHKFVVGNPYRVEFMKGGVPDERHIIEHVTIVEDITVLGRTAMHLCKLVPAGIAWSKDKPVQVFRKMLFDINLGEVKREAVPSPEVRTAVIEKALDSPGSAQRELRTIKKRLEEMQHLTTEILPQISHDDLVDLIHKAAPDDVVDPGTVDNNLREIMLSAQISINNFVNPELQQHIYDNAPSEIVVGGTALRIAYRNGQPIVRHFTRHVVLDLEEELYLKDGRQVLFTFTSDGHTKTYSIARLREKVAEELESADRLYA